MSRRGEANIREAPGAAWIERFLLPCFEKFFPGREALSCLQIAPDDSTEAEKLRQLGHRCEMFTPTPGQKLPFDDASFDFIFTGRFPRLATTLETRIGLATEFRRLIKPAGAALLVIGNRLSPIDLSRNDSLVHGRNANGCLSWSEIEDVFIREAGFQRITPLPVHGHFSWNCFPAPLRPIGKIFDAYWRYLATPNRPRLYTSALNPTLILWAHQD